MNDHIKILLFVILVAWAVTATAAPAPAAPGLSNAGSTLKPPPTAPTPDLAKVASAISVDHKSLTIFVTVKPALQLTSPVTISIGYDGPRQTQLYIASTGNRFVYYDHTFV